MLIVLGDTIVLVFSNNKILFSRKNNSSNRFLIRLTWELVEVLSNRVEFPKIGPSPPVGQTDRLLRAKVIFSWVLDMYSRPQSATRESSGDGTVYVAMHGFRGYKMAATVRDWILRENLPIFRKYNIFSGAKAHGEPSRSRIWYLLIHWVATMPPKKKKSGKKKKKSGKKSAKTEKQTGTKAELNELGKEYYMIQIRDLETRLARLVMLISCLSTFQLIL